MNDPTGKVPPPLPPEWLPDPRPQESDPEWNVRVARIMAAADPALARLTVARPSDGTPWWSVLANWWRPSAAFAAAATALLVVVDRPAAPSSASPGAITLTLLAAEGDPVALWDALGVAADPVLALLALQDHSGFAGPGGAVNGSGGDAR